MSAVTQVWCPLRSHRLECSQHAMAQTPNINKMTKPWNKGVAGIQVLPLINRDAETLRVEAGPGTGKTFGLARRVVRIMHPDGLGVSGKDVLVVAFNRVIAQQLQADIGKTLADSGISAENTPIIRTVHALCLQVVGEDVRLLLPHEREAMLYDVLHQYSAIKTKYCKHRNADQALRDHEAKHHEHMELWQAVKRWLVRHRAQLISELPGMLLDHIKGGDFSDRTYRHVIVDEYQDLTPGEQQLFLKLKMPDGQFVALGDPRQSIYAFRGNDRDGLRKLEDILDPTADPVTNLTMTECRRCPDQVVMAANQLMSLSPAERMVPGSATHGAIHVVYWRTPSREAAGMAKGICANILQYPKERHLVMVTRRQFGFMLRDEIAKLDPTVSVDLSFSESLLEAWPVREAFLFFCLLVDPDGPTWRAWLGYQNSPTANTPLAPERNSGAYLQFLTRHSDKIMAKGVERLAMEPREKPRGTGGTNLWDRAKRFVDLRKAFQLGGESATEFIDAALQPGFWIEGSSEKDAASVDMALLRQKALEMVDDVEKNDNGQAAGEILQRIARQLRYLIATREPFAANAEVTSLQVATLWGAKGVTSDHVYILGLCQEAIPGTRREEYPGTDEEFVEEQRRLFYVSITRPRRTLVLSRAEKIRPGEAQRLNLSIRQLRGHWADLRMSTFLRDIMSFLPEAQSGESWAGV
jgi:superfamily I DNA/RNA helicase